MDRDIATLPHAAKAGRGHVTPVTGVTVINIEVGHLTTVARPVPPKSKMRDSDKVIGPPLFSWARQLTSVARSFPVHGRAGTVCDVRAVVYAKWYLTKSKHLTNSSLVAGRKPGRCGTLPNSLINN